MCGYVFYVQDSVLLLLLLQYIICTVYSACTVCGFMYDLLHLPHVYFVEYCILQCSAFNLTFHFQCQVWNRSNIYFLTHLIWLPKIKAIFIQNWVTKKIISRHHSLNRMQHVTWWGHVTNVAFCLKWWLWNNTNCFTCYLFFLLVCSI